MSKLRQRPDEAILRHYIEEGKSSHEIATLLGYGRHGYSNVLHWCRRYGLPSDLGPDGLLRRTPFSAEQKEIIYGTMLGDGYVRPPGKIVIAQGVKQRAYLEWKREKLLPFITRTEPDLIPAPGGPYSADGTLTYYSVTHPWVKELRQKMYGSGRKALYPEWLEALTPLSLAVWFMDDGSSNRYDKTMVISSLSFTYEENAELCRLLERRWDIWGKVYHAKRAMYGLRFGAEAATHLRELIAPLIPPFMAYKVKAP